MEIPDVIAINKMDHPAAKTMLTEVRSVLSLDRDRPWKVPIVLTEAHRGENVPELWEKVEEHRAFLEREGGLEERRRRNLAGEVYAVASARARAHLERGGRGRPRARSGCSTTCRRARLDPLSAVSEIMSRVFGIDGRCRRSADIERARGRLAGRRARHARLPLGDVLAPRRPRGAPEGREPPADRLVQDPRRGQQAVDARRGRARGRRRRRERRQPRAGGRLGGARGGRPRDDLRPAGRGDGEGRGDEGLRRRRRAWCGEALEEALADGAPRRSRRRARRSSTRSRTRRSSPGRGRSASSSPSRCRTRRPCSCRSAAAGSPPGSRWRSRLVQPGDEGDRHPRRARRIRARRRDRGQAAGRAHRAAPRRRCSTTSSRSSGDDIAQAIVLLLERTKLVVEGAGRRRRRRAARAGRSRATGRSPSFSPAATSTRAR